MSLATKSLWGFAAFALAFAPAALRADLDKEAKEKKEKEAMRPAMGDDEHEEHHQKLIEEGKKNLEEINRLLEEIQKSLGDKQTGAPTQARQKQVVERIEKLIKELEKG
ncbi:MAG: hypothetical protein HY721_10785 [Planctomycetes bacterium]|nr:hypothetical protein [Planctomycetota bacterium]